MSKPAGERYTIAVDFDGVIHSYISPWVAPDVIPDEPVSGAIEWLNRIINKFVVVIFTTRGQSPEGRSAVRLWLAKHGFTGSVEVTDHKPPALVYLDDRGLRFSGTFPTADEIHQLKPWNKQ